MLKRLREATKDMTVSEALLKLGIASIFQLIIIGAFATGGYFLAQNVMEATPLNKALITIAGAIIGTFFAFLGIIYIVSFGHKGD